MNRAPQAYQSLTRNYENMYRRTRENYVIRIISATPVDEAHVRDAPMRDAFMADLLDAIGKAMR